MPRTEIILNTGWEFSLNNKDNYTPAQLPHDWAITAPFEKTMVQAEAQGFRNRWGIGYYRTRVQLEEKKQGHCYMLAFDGIYECSTVFLNGKEIGGHAYGYSPFRIDVTDTVCSGENYLEISVDNTQTPADRWYSGAGLYRNVRLLELETLHLDPWETIVRTALTEEGATVEVSTGIDGHIVATLENADGSLSSEGAQGELCFMVNKPRLWSAEQPNLYRLTLHLMRDDMIADTISLQVGIREITVDSKRGMLVNGVPTKLKGVCVHQDVGCRGIAAKVEIWRKRLLELKAMGCNSIRPAHHVYDSFFYDLCDELGFYVYEECFDKWTGGLYGRYFAENWRYDLGIMIRRDRNHPCVCMWGVGNEVENQAQESMLEILKMLTDEARRLDPTRPITCAMNPHFKYESSANAATVADIQRFVDEVDDSEIFDIDEKVACIAKIAQHVDIISCNYMEQWYPQIHAAVPNKPILGTEVYQFFKGHEKQMKNFSMEIPALVPEQYNYVIGCMIWTGIDYLGESAGYPAKGWGGSLIRTNLEKRFTYYLMQSYWSEVPMVHVSVLDYSLMDEGVKAHWDMPLCADHWHFPQFHHVLIPFFIASNCEEVVLYVNGEPFYQPSPATCPNKMIMGFAPYEAGELRVVGYNKGQEVCNHILHTPQAVTQLVFDPVPQDLPVQAGQEVLLTVRVTDCNGVPCVRANGIVQFAVEGDAEIIGVDSGNLMSDEVYHAQSVSLFRGVASVQLRLGTTSEEIQINVYGEGIRSGTIVLSVKA